MTIPQARNYQAGSGISRRCRRLLRRYIPRRGLTTDGISFLLMLSWSSFRRSFLITTVNPVIPLLFTAGTRLTLQIRPLPFPSFSRGRICRVVQDVHTDFNGTPNQGNYNDYKSEAAGDAGTMKASSSTETALAMLPTNGTASLPSPRSSPPRGSQLPDYFFKPREMERRRGSRSRKTGGSPMTVSRG